ncbi:hypothetical protein PPTG_00880 [Phytophthora nicotianae INRA-310]|uniref:Uncharacterized protein n=1 Tax=Phytophthora nicotianae (strain INRA-310) TaxID=761204 RepID=W2RHE6_PHYN3|nr:hypothetical protein PPTG_00880 [Phytophthora nicotianae INRA-310]ETN24651.1 hypothetical protein PPTG_00880 [Phytophthora nicotianae INRA-310]
MLSSTDILPSSAFFEEAADFFDNCFPPSSPLFNSIEESESSAAADMLTILDPSDEASNSSSPTNPPPSNTTADERDLAVIALNMHREKEKLRRRKQRQRIKDELDKLRRAHGELDDQLKKLKLAKEAKRNPSQHWSIWKELALVQRKERHRSETEKRRLTTTAKTQEIYIDNLRGLLRQHRYAATLENTVPRSVINTAEHRLEAADMSMLSSLLLKIGPCLAKIDDLLTGCGLPTMPLGVTNSMNWCDESGELKYHQNLQKFALPFDLETSQQSCWEAFQFKQHQCDRGDYNGIGDSENTVALKYRVIRTLASGSTVSVVERRVARRFIEQDRVVGIWKTYTEGEGIFRGMHSNQTGWSWLRQLPDGSGTVGEVCIRQCPVLFNTSPSATDEFYRFLQALLDEEKYEMLGAISNSVPKSYGTV